MRKRSVGRIIGEIARTGHNFLQQQFGLYSIGHAQIRTLLYLAENRGKTQKELVEFIHLDKSSITSQIKILEKNGYITRMASKEDGRKQVIDITEKTEQLLPELRVVLDSWTEALLNGFSEEEKEVLHQYLERMRTNALHKRAEMCRNNEKVE